MVNKVRLLTFTLILALMVAISAYFLAQNRGRNVLSQKIGEMALVEYVTGEDAIRSIEQLHIGNITGMRNGYIAIYQSQDNAIVHIWVLEAVDGNLARRWLESMSAKIGPEFGYAPPQMITLSDANSLTAYYTEGHGMNHYYFVKDSRLYWVALINVESAEQFEFIREIIETG